jgi:glycosyltransferase involved in cell wall biosynthesis
MISLIIPAYNEEHTIKKTIESIKSTLKNINIEIIVINDGSIDRTSAVLKKISGIRIIEHIKNKGYGAAIKTGVKHSSGEWILIIDVDGTYPPEAIPSLLKYTKDYDMVVGARIGKKVNIPLFRKPAKWILSKFANYLAEERIPDLNSGLRIFKKDIVLRFYDLFPNGFSFTSTITLACLTNGYNVKFVPIDYMKRDKKSKSSIKPFKDFVGFMKLIFKMSLYFRPLKVFNPIGFILLLFGVIFGVNSRIRYDSFGAGNVMIVLASIQIVFLGLIADLIIKRTRL